MRPDEHWNGGKKGPTGEGGGEEKQTMVEKIDRSLLCLRLLFAPPPPPLCSVAHHTRFTQLVDSGYRMSAGLTAACYACSTAIQNATGATMMMILSLMTLG